MLREADGDYGDAADAWVQLRELPHGTRELLAVVIARAADYLTVHRDARRGEAAQGAHDVRGFRVPHELHAHLRVRGVDGDVDGAYFQLADALQLPLGEVRERYIAAREERKARVVVLEVQRPAQAARELVYEAEKAVVGAAPGLVHEVFLKIEAQVLALALAELHLVLLPGPRRAQAERQPRLVGPVAVVQHVLDLVAVYRQQLVAHMHLAPRRGGLIYISYRVQHPKSLAEFARSAKNCNPFFPGACTSEKTLLSRKCAAMGRARSATPRQEAAAEGGQLLTQTPSFSF